MITQPKVEEINLMRLERLLCHRPQAASQFHLTHHNVIISPAVAWSSPQRSAGRHATCKAPVCWQIMYFPLCRASFVPANDSYPQSLITPKHLIKTNSVSREIKPTLAEEGHRHQASLRASFMSPVPTPSPSFPLIVCATHPPPPNLPLTGEECAAVKRGTSTIRLLSSPDGFMDGGMISTGKFNRGAFRVVTEGSSPSSDFHFSDREPFVRGRPPISPPPRQM